MFFQLLLSAPSARMVTRTARGMRAVTLLFGKLSRATIIATPANFSASFSGLDKFGVQTYLNPSKNCVEAAGCPAAGAFYAGTTSNTCVACDAGVAACTRNGPGGATAW